MRTLEAGYLIYYTLIKYNTLTVEAFKMYRQYFFLLHLQYNFAILMVPDPINVNKTYNYKMCKNFFRIINYNKNLFGILWNYDVKMSINIAT